MRRILRHVVSLLLVLVFATTAQTQTKTPFPASSIEGKTALRASLQAIGASPLDALESRAALKRLFGELNNRYSSLPTLEDSKRLLIQMDPVLGSQLMISDPDLAPLRGTVFSRQNLRGSNPDLQRVQDHTWPPDLSHGEKVSLQYYSENGSGPINQALRNTGQVTPVHAQVHSRMQSAFRKARPFSPAVTVSRGINIPGKPALDSFLNPLNDALKKGTTYAMRGYVSTTVGTKVSGSFAGGNVHMHIKATHGVDLYPISNYPEERELLLNHNSTYRVTSIRMEGTRHIIEFEQLPPEGK